VVEIDTESSIRADVSRLKQVFENLIRNATEHGGPDVTVTVGELDDGFYLEDDGPGIPDEERSRILETGYSTAEAGTGFGLSIVDQIVDAHGWQLRITESEAGGARFEIIDVETLP
jgi:signal transduction histidine kinase